MGETNEAGVPVRYEWAANYSRLLTIVSEYAGNEPVWLNNTVCINVNCIFRRLPLHHSSPIFAASAPTSPSLPSCSASSEARLRSRRDGQGAERAIVPGRRHCRLLLCAHLHRCLSRQLCGPNRVGDHARDPFKTLIGCMSRRASSLPMLPCGPSREPPREPASAVLRAFANGAGACSPGTATSCKGCSAARCTRSRLPSECHLRYAGREPVGSACSVMTTRFELGMARQLRD